MKVIFDPEFTGGDRAVISGRIAVELTRRNLNSLLAKLDGNPPNSACTIIDRDGFVAVKAVEDAEHYSDRAPGAMHPDTEASIP